MRDRLIELLDIIIQPGEKTMGDIADYLLANGVIVKPICSECFFDDGLNWHQCERCVGGKVNAFVSIEECEKV